MSLSRVFLAVFITAAPAPKPMAARMAMIAITTRSSMRVKPWFLKRVEVIFIAGQGLGNILWAGRKVERSPHFGNPPVGGNYNVIRT